MAMAIAGTQSVPRLRPIPGSGALGSAIDATAHVAAYAAVAWRIVCLCAPAVTSTEGPCATAQSRGPIEQGLQLLVPAQVPARTHHGVAG